MTEAEPTPDHVFDGGSLDCGSGLVLLIRNNMRQVPVGGVLEIRSSEATVASDLPPWCRLTGHEHLASSEFQPGRWRHLVRRGPDNDDTRAAEASEQNAARDFEWSVRLRRTQPGEHRAYARNLSWALGPSLSFDTRGEFASALEQFVGAVLADVVASFANACDQAAIALDDLEATANTKLVNPLAAIRAEPGNPAIDEIRLAVFATSPAPRERLDAAWESAVAAAPLLNTLAAACRVERRLVIL